MNYSGIIILVLLLVLADILWPSIKNESTNKENDKLKLAILILSYNLDLYNTLYGMIDKKDFDKANLIITQARRKEEANGRNPE